MACATMSLAARAAACAGSRRLAAQVPAARAALRPSAQYRSAWELGLPQAFQAAGEQLLLRASTTQVRSASSAEASSSVSPGRSLSSKLGLPEGQLPRWELRMLFDGDCPLCMREVNMLRDMDKGAGKIDFVDIAAADYDPAKNMDLDFETVMKSIHAILPDGKVVSGIEVFRRLYDAVGLGWVYAITEVPAVGRLADRVYDFWARNRMAVTGRPDLAVILAEKKTASCRAPDEQ